MLSPCNGQLEIWPLRENSCPTLCNPMECSTPGLPVHHQLPELTQTHAHWVGDTLQPANPLSSPSPPYIIVFKIFILYSGHKSLIKHAICKYFLLVYDFFSLFISFSISFAKKICLMLIKFNLYFYFMIKIFIFISCSIWNLCKILIIVLPDILQFRVLNLCV